MFEINVGYSSGVVSSAVTLSHSPTARLRIISAEARAVSSVHCICLKNTQWETEKFHVGFLSYSKEVAHSLFSTKYCHHSKLQSHIYTFVCVGAWSRGICMYYWYYYYYLGLNHTVRGKVALSGTSRMFNMLMLEQDKNNAYTLGNPWTIKPRGFVNEHRAYGICEQNTLNYHCRLRG